MKSLKKRLIKLAIVLLLITLDVVTTIAINRTQSCTVQQQNN